MLVILGKLGVQENVVIVVEAMMTTVMIVTIVEGVRAGVEM
jgi:hypothetical protein